MYSPIEVHQHIHFHTDVHVHTVDPALLALNILAALGVPTVVINNPTFNFGAPTTNLFGPIGCTFAPYFAQEGPLYTGPFNGPFYNGPYHANANIPPAELQALAQKRRIGFLN